MGFGQDNDKKHCKSYVLKRFLSMRIASHGLGDIRITNHGISTCIAQHKIFLFTKHFTVHLTICCYEQKEGNITSTLNPNATNHIEWRVWSCVSKYEEGLDFFFITIILSHALEI